MLCASQGGIVPKLRKAGGPFAANNNPSSYYYYHSYISAVSVVIVIWLEVQWSRKIISSGVAKKTMRAEIAASSEKHIIMVFHIS